MLIGGGTGSAGGGKSGGPVGTGCSGCSSSLSLSGRARSICTDGNRCGRSGGMGVGAVGGSFGVDLSRKLLSSKMTSVDMTVHLNN